uniref:Mitochondrial ribosomal protein s22 n=2 Tax=unclassified Macrotrachela TaxID=2624746 RepID=A0A0G3VYS9_9BILA|nr:mitochondrial ribosomal protein s22 [Macrotrachela sp. CR]AKL90133.1 mitochondrial ribosomal protein s22 [Macrotrachela sp. MA]
MFRSLIRPSTCVRCLINRIQCNSTNKSIIFIRKDVQDILTNITGFDLSRIFRRRNNKSLDRIVYKYLTDKQLKEEQEKTIERGQAKLQMPPVLLEAKENIEILEKDDMLSQFSSSKHLFIDISLGIPIRDRLILARDTDGTLRTATLDEKRRMRQIYFPISGRELITPKMFEEEHLEKILERGDYEFILDRACTQFEPDDRDYIRVTHRTYEHIDQTNSYDLLRSTRHFGPMIFYYVWFKKIDRLMDDIIRRDLINDAISLLRLYAIIHPDSKVAEYNFNDTNSIDLIQTYIDHEARIPDVVSEALRQYIRKTQHHAVTSG